MCNISQYINLEDHLLYRRPSKFAPNYLNSCILEESDGRVEIKSEEGETRGSFSSLEQAELFCSIWKINVIKKPNIVTKQ